MSIVSAKWVRHRLTPDQSESRLEVATNLPLRVDLEGKALFYQESLLSIKCGWSRMTLSLKDISQEVSSDTPDRSIGLLSLHHRGIFSKRFALSGSAIS